MIRGVMAACIAVCVCVSAWPASARGFIDGNKLHDICVETDERIVGTVCAMYVAGVVDAMLVMKDMIGEQIAFCVPEGVTIGQLVDVFAKYLRDHPEERHLHGAVLVITAVSDAFPCPAAD